MKRINKIKSSDELLKISTQAIIPSVRRGIFLIIILILFSPGLYKISKSSETILKFEELISITNNTILALFGAIVTAYSILFALVRKEVLQLLVKYPAKNEKKKDNKKAMKKIKENYSVWDYINYSIVGVLFSFLFIIIINYFLNFFFVICGKDWFLNISNTVNTNICFFFIILYFGITLNAIIEIKSFIYSLTQVFYIDNSLKLKEDNKKDEL